MPGTGSGANDGKADIWKASGKGLLPPPVSVLWNHDPDWRCDNGVGTELESGVQSFVVRHNRCYHGGDDNT